MSTLGGDENSYDEVVMERFQMKDNYAYHQWPQLTPHQRTTYREKMGSHSNWKKILCLVLSFLFVVLVLCGALSVVAVNFFAISNMKSSLSILLDTQHELNRSLTSIRHQLGEQKSLDDNFLELNRSLTTIWALYEALQLRLNTAVGVLINPGSSSFNPAFSCSAILLHFPSSPSGYYWIRSSNGSAVSVYCDMTRSCGNITGGWMRVAGLNMADSSSQCPGDGLSLFSGQFGYYISSVRVCAIAAGVQCSSAMFPVIGVEHSRVCGRVIGYQRSTTDAFGYISHLNAHLNATIDDPYVDGVSLTHGSPRQHIWSFASAYGQSPPISNCFCTSPAYANHASVPPPFVGNDYFCDTGFPNNSPLWEGAGCETENTCCSYNNPPWFYKQLPQPTTDDIEMRVCRDQVSGGDENVAVEIVDIYVQ